MRNFTHTWPQLGHFFCKLGHFYPIFEKVQGSSPPPSPSNYAPEQGYSEVVIGNLFIIFIMY